MAAEGDQPVAAGKVAPPGWVTLEIRDRPPVTIRPGLQGDEPRVAALYVEGERVAYGDFAPPQYLHALDVDAEIPLWLKEIENPGSFLYVAVADDQLIGFANGGIADEAIATLSDTWVTPDWHHTGVAQALAAATVERIGEAGAKILKAMVHPQNKAGEGFRKKLGAVYKGYFPNVLWFRATDHLPDFYGTFGVWEWAEVDKFGKGPAKALWQVARMPRHSKGKTKLGG